MMHICIICRLSSILCVWCKCISKSHHFHFRFFAPFSNSYFSECAQIIIGTIMLTRMKIENLYFFSFLFYFLVFIRIISELLFGKEEVFTVHYSDSNMCVSPSFCQWYLVLWQWISLKNSWLTVWSGKQSKDIYYCEAIESWARVGRITKKKMKCNEKWNDSGKTKEKVANISNLLY